MTISRVIWSLLALAAGAGLIAGEPAPALRVGIAPVSPPMIFKEGDKVVGLEADLARALGRELNREVRFIELSWEDLIDALVDGKIDIIMSAMTITRARQARVAFSDPYLRIGLAALVRANETYRYVFFENGLAGHTLGVRKATTGDLLVQQEFPRAKRKYFKSDEEGAVALTKGKIDLFIDDSTMIWYLAGTHEDKGLAVAPFVLSDEMLGWAMRRSDVPLQQSVNAFLKKSKESGELEQVLHRWIPKFH